MNRDTAVRLAQEAIKAKNKRLVDAVLRIRAETGGTSAAPGPVSALPTIAVTCATGWECYAIVDELEVEQGPDGRGTVVRMVKYLTPSA